MNTTYNGIEVEDMGTTGLIEFYYRSNNSKFRGDWQRLQKVVGVIRRRYGEKAVVPFCKAIFAAFPDKNRHAVRRTARQLASFGFTPDAN